MTQAEFRDVQTELARLAGGVAEEKRADYAKDYDVLDNFKLVSDIAGLGDRGALLVWLVYFAKHVVAVGKYAGGQDLVGESVASRFADLFNYVQLGYALMKEFEAGRDTGEIVDIGAVENSPLLELFEKQAPTSTAPKNPVDALLQLAKNTVNNFKKP